jgi:uncharacterized membrane protein
MRLSCPVPPISWFLWGFIVYFHGKSTKIDCQEEALTLENDNSAGANTPQVLEYSKHRFEFFSDGVMAIIMTIMAIEIPVSDIFSLEKIGELLESILIFFVSFFIVGWFWNRHHRLIDGVQKITERIVWRNLFFLFFLALLPLFTKWMLLNPDNIITVISYGVVYLIVHFCFFVLSREVYHEIRHELCHEFHEHVKRHSASFVIFIRYIIHCIILIGLFVFGILFPQFSILIYIAFPLAFTFLLYLEKKIDGV